MLNKASEIHPHCIGGKNNGCNNEISLISILTMNTSRDWTSTNSLRPVPVSHHLHHLIFLSHIYSESALFQLKPLATVLSLQVLVKRSPSSFIVRPFKYWKVLEGVPGTCSSPAWTTPTLSSCPHRRGAQAHYHFHAPSLSYAADPYLSCAEGPWAGNSAPGRVSWIWS